MTDDTADFQAAYTPADPVAHARRLQRNESWQAFLICGAILVMSFVLHPDRRGYGTHTHLLLPPCFFRVATHLPCPFCGMTTGFTQMARGHVAAAAQSNCMAPPAYLATIILALLGLWGLLTGRRWVPQFAHTKTFGQLVLAVILAFWIANLMNLLVLRI